MISRVFGLFVLVAVLLFSCEGSKKSVDQVGNKDIRKSITVPSFNRDSAYIFIQDQVNFGPRVPNTNGHRLCGNYLEDQLRLFGAKVTVQEFTEQAYDGTILNLKNIIGSYNPDVRKRVLLAAHWDTRPYADKDSEGRYDPIPGANDGASGVGVLLEIARQTRPSLYNLQFEKPKN